jgi:putative tryptophan/tyrosine transport system substrate-binding protein
MQSRRILLRSCLAGACAIALRAFAQAKLPRIGYLQLLSPQNGTSAFLEAFRRGMRESGYEEGRNYRLEVRWGEGQLETLPVAAADLVRQNVDVIVAISSPAVIAAKGATKAIPIVMALSSDPVGDGLVASLARPGGNITGLSQMSPELGTRRLQILREIVQKPARPLAVLWNPDYAGMHARYRDAAASAPNVGSVLRSVEIRDARDLERALATLDHERPDALLLLADPLTLSQRARIVAFAAEQRLPAMYEAPQFVDAGGLASYGTNPEHLVQRSAIYVDKILKGAKPGDLPIEQPSKFELVINLKAARAIGLTVPQSVLLQADRVID